MTVHYEKVSLNGNTIQAGFYPRTHKISTTLQDLIIHSAGERVKT